MDMLNKMIEERHVEDELAMQASLRLGDGLRVLSATVNHPSSTPQPAPAAGLRRPSMGPLQELLMSRDPSAAKGDQVQEKAEKAAGDTERVPRVAFSLVCMVVCQFVQQCVSLYSSVLLCTVVCWFVQ